MHTTDNPTATIMKALSCIFNQGSCPGSLPYVPSRPTRVHVLRVCQTAHYDQLCERQRTCTALHQHRLAQTVTLSTRRSLIDLYNV